MSSARARRCARRLAGLASLALTSIVWLASTACAGSALLTWEPPSTRTDGSALADLTSYRAYWGCGDVAGYPFSVMFPAEGTSRAIEGLPDGVTCRFVLTAIDSQGRESAYSNEASKVMPIVPVGDPVVGPTITWREAIVVPTKDATGTIFTFNANGSGGSPLTQSYEVSAGTDRVLVARVLYYHPTTRNLTVTYGGQALTRHGFARYAENDAGDYAEIWYLVNPPVGTANLVLTSSASGAAMSVAVDAWTGVNQTTPFRAATANTGDSSSPGLSGISAQAGDVVLDILGSYVFSEYTLTSNQTLDVKNEADGGAHSLGASRKTATGASESVSWSLSTSASWWYVAAALAPAVFEEPVDAGRGRLIHGKLVGGILVGVH